MLRCWGQHSSLWTWGHTSAHNNRCWGHDGPPLAPLLSDICRMGCPWGHAAGMISISAGGEGVSVGPGPQHMAGTFQEGTGLLLEAGADVSCDQGGPSPSHKESWAETVTPDSHPELPLARGSRPSNERPLAGWLAPRHRPRASPSGFNSNSAKGSS